MAEIKVPIKIDGFKCVEDMAQAVLNYTYKGKTLKEWVDSILEPITNADRLRAKTDEELADELLEWFACFMAVEWSRDMILDWLKEEAEGRE